MRTVQQTFLVHTEAGRDNYQLRTELWKEGFRGANAERDTRVVEEVSLSAWIVSPIDKHGIRTGEPVLKEVRDGNSITWILDAGGDIPGMPVVLIEEVLPLDSALNPPEFVQIMKDGGTRVFTDNYQL